MNRLAHETGDAFPPTAIEITRMKGCFAWTTADEVRFIERLGTHSLHGPTLDYRTWVKRYTKTLSLRKQWDAMDQQAVRQAARAALA